MRTSIAAADRLLLATLIALIVSVGQAHADCGTERFMGRLLSSNHHYWTPNGRIEKGTQSKAAANADVMPITGIAVHNHRVWVKTFGAEYNTVSAHMAGDRISLQPIMFLLPTPKGGADQRANLVKMYTGPDVRFSLSPYQNDCSVTTFVLTIENIPTDRGSSTERWLFTQTK